MVYITGDIHGDPRDLIRFSEAHSITFEVIIILGAASFNFYLHGRDRKAKSWWHTFPRPCSTSMVITSYARSRFPNSIMRKSASVACISHHTE